MQEKLNSEQPDKRKRRLFFFIPPVGCAAFVLALLAGGIAIWCKYHKEKTPLQEKPALSSTIQLTDTLQIQKHLTANNNSNDKSKTSTIINDTQLLSVNTKTPVASIKQTPAAKPKLTAYYGPGALKNPAQEQQLFAHKNRNNTPSLPVDENNSRTALTRDLPFATPQLTALPGMTISVNTDIPLPGVASAGNKSPDSNRNKTYVVSTGLQWQAPVPVTGMDHYFKGANGNNQPYLMLIPGFWLSVAKNRHQLMANMMPFTSAILPDKYYEEGLVRVSDSLIAYKRMVKTFGLQAGLRYNYQVNTHWYIGAGLDANWWKKGLVLAKPINDSLPVKPFLYTTDPKKEKKLNPFQVSMVLETGCWWKAWECMLQLSRPWNTTVKDLSPPVWLRLGIRYRLLQKKVGQ